MEYGILHESRHDITIQKKSLNNEREREKTY